MSTVCVFAVSVQFVSADSKEWQKLKCYQSENVWKMKCALTDSGHLMVWQQKASHYESNSVLALEVQMEAETNLVTSVGTEILAQTETLGEEYRNGLSGLLLLGDSLILAGLKCE